MVVTWYKATFAMSPMWQPDGDAILFAQKRRQEGYSGPEHQQRLPQIVLTRVLQQPSDIAGTVHHGRCGLNGTVLGAKIPAKIGKAKISKACFGGPFQHGVPTRRRGHFIRNQNPFIAMCVMAIKPSISWQAMSEEYLPRPKIDLVQQSLCFFQRPGRRRR